MCYNNGEDGDGCIKEMGLEEGIQKLTDLFVDNLMIRGEETEDLKVALHRAPDKYITYAERNKAAKEIEKKVYPNDPCPCGSGKKYKKCCGRK